MSFRRARPSIVFLVTRINMQRSKENGSKNSVSVKKGNKVKKRSNMGISMGGTLTRAHVHNVGGKLVSVF